MSSTITQTRPWLLRWQPSRDIRLRLAVDDSHNGGHPIHREFDLPSFYVEAKGVTDQHAMRKGVVKPVADHLADVQACYPEEDLLAYVGNGNLLANPGFVAWHKGVFYCLGAESVFSQLYTCIVSWKDGQVTVEDVWFGQENGKAIILRKVDSTVNDCTEEVDFATSCQPIVRGGQRTVLEQLAEKWYDIRQLVQPLRISINGTALFVPNAQLQQGLLRKALCRAVHVRLETRVDQETVLPLTIAGWLQLARDRPCDVATALAFLRAHGLLNDAGHETDTLLKAAEITDSALRTALREANYRLTDDDRPLRDGEARFINGHLEIYFHKAIYPHNLFVRWPDGACGFVVYPGKSGRQGTTLPDAQEFLTEQLHVQDAILLDNGGDVRLWYRGQALVPSSEGREELRSLLVITGRKSARESQCITLA